MIILNIAPTVKREAANPEVETKPLNSEALKPQIPFLGFLV